MKKRYFECPRFSIPSRQLSFCSHKSGSPLWLYLFVPFWYSLCNPYTALEISKDQSHENNKVDEFWACGNEGVSQGQVCLGETEGLGEGGNALWWKGKEVLDVPWWEVFGTGSWRLIRRRISYMLDFKLKTGIKIGNVPSICNSCNSLKKIGISSAILCMKTLWWISRFWGRIMHQFKKQTIEGRLVK